MSSIRSKSWMVMAAVDGMKDQGHATSNCTIKSAQQHVKNNVRSYSNQANKHNNISSSGSSSSSSSVAVVISHKSRDDRLKQSEESLRTVMYLSCWGPN